MLVYPGVVDKVANGSTVATLSGFNTTIGSGPVPGTVTLNPGGTANFDTPFAGNGKIVTFSGVGISQGPIVLGGLASNFALPVACCGPAVLRTTGNITAAPPPPPPPPPPGGPGAPGALITTVGATPLAILPVFYPSTVLAGLNLDVVGMTMPPIQVAEIIPVEAAPQLPAFVDTPLPVYVPPVMPVRPDRN
jgi:hypothetical protein